MVILLPHKDVTGNLSHIILVELVSVHAFIPSLYRGCSTLQRPVQSGIHGVQLTMKRVSCALGSF